MKRISASSHHAKMLTEAVTDFIVRDMRPINAVDGEGFVNLMQVAEPRYTVPCRKTIKGLVDQKFISMKTRQKFILLFLSYH